MERQIEFLNALSNERSKKVIKTLKTGDSILKSMVLEYTIDNQDIDLQLGKFPNGSIPYRQIYSKLSGDSRDILDQFNRRDNIPFTEIFNAGLGQCLEKAVLVQLAAQRQEESFLISGVIEVDEALGANHHAYNIVARSGKLFLVDAQNPAGISKDGTIHPYVAPVVDIVGKSGEIQVSPEWRMNRTYTID